jgi:hypothetical protein
MAFLGKYRTAISIAVAVTLILIFMIIVWGGLEKPAISIVPKATILSWLALSQICHSAIGAA